MQPVTSTPKNSLINADQALNAPGASDNVKDLSRIVPKTPAPISPSLAGRAVFTIDDIELEEDVTGTNNDNAQQARPLQDTLDHVKELTGETASLRQYLSTLDKTSGQALEDKKTIHASFERYLEQYKALVEMACQLSDETFKAEKNLSRKISKGLNWQAPLTEIAKRHLRLIGTNIKGIDARETSYQEQKTKSTTALADLHSNWNALCANLNEAYSLLCWLEALQEKPAGVEKERFYAEFLYNLPKISKIPHPGLPSMHEKTALLGRLEQALGEMVKLKAEAESLANSAKLNPNKNAQKIETKYFVVAAKFGKFVLDALSPLLAEVPGHLQTLEEKLKQSECPPLRPKAWRSLSHYRSLDIKSIQHAEQQHQQDQNDWNTELQQVQATWKTLTETVQDAREKINAVACVLQQHRKTDYPSFESPLPQTVQSTDDNCKVEPDETDICLKNAEELLGAIEKSIETAKSHYSSWSKATPEQIKLVQSSYIQHYNDVEKAFSALDAEIEDWQETLKITQQEIQEHTLPPLPEDLGTYLQAYGKLKGKEEKYSSRFNKMQEVHHEHATQLAALKEDENEAKEILHSLEKIRKSISERLCRLAEAYETGYLTWQRLSNFQGHTYSVPPEPATLRAKYHPEPAPANEG